MKFINSIREKYHVRRAIYCIRQANKNLDNPYIYSRWMWIFEEHWDTYTELVNKRLGIA